MKFNEIPTPKKRLTPAKAIKFYCRWICCANDLKSWADCEVTRCALHPYRKGKRASKTHSYLPKKSEIKQSGGGMKWNAITLTATDKQQTDLI